MKSENILVVDDDEQHLGIIALVLEDTYQLTGARSGEEAISIMALQSFDLVILDLMMPGGMNGLQTLKIIKEKWPATEVIMNTVIRDSDKIVEAVKSGAYDYLIKGCSPEDLANKVKNALEKARNQRRIENVAETLREKVFGDMLIGPSRASQELLIHLRFAASCQATCLLMGETGTGKDLAARFIHHHGSRSRDPFVALNLPAIPKNLMESTLFGHEKGSFTSAMRTQIGKFELANGGTLMLDEIGDLDEDSQVKLLRVIEDGEVEHIGSNKKIRVDVRIIAATSHHLEDLVKLGKFREDLFYRLNVVSIDLPALRNRPEDIDYLAAHFVRLYSLKYKKNIRGIAPEAMNLLRRHRWRGNIRELSHVIERMFIYADGDVLGVGTLPTEIAIPLPHTDKAGTLSDKRDDYEKTLIHQALVMHGFNRSRAARELGIPVETLRYRIQKLGIATEPDLGESNAG